HAGARSGSLDAGGPATPGPGTATSIAPRTTPSHPWETRTTVRPTPSSHWAQRTAPQPGRRDHTMTRPASRDAGGGCRRLARPLLGLARVRRADGGGPG